MTPDTPLSPEWWRRLWLCCGWSMIGLVILLSLIPGPPSLDFDQGDKLQHLAGYGVLMFWFAQLYRRAATRLHWAVGLAILGVFLEVLQGMTSWRSYDVHDMAANSAGVLLGWLLAPPRGPDLYNRIAGAILRQR